MTIKRTVIFRNNFTKILMCHIQTISYPALSHQTGAYNLWQRKKLWLTQIDMVKFTDIWTPTCQITCGNGEVFSSPTKFISKFQSAMHIQTMILFFAKPERHLETRLRGACRSNKNSKYSSNKNYKARGAHSVERTNTNPRKTVIVALRVTWG